MSRRKDPVPAAQSATATAASFGQETDNALKFEQPGGVEERLLARFKERLLAEAAALAPARLLDAGCGEGYVTSWLVEALPGSEVTGVEGREEALAAFRERLPAARAVQGDLRQLPFADGSFELVVCTEVLEHLAEPGAALRELARVSSGHLLLTVPHEPLFRAGNLARGRYVARLGSTPGHLSTWTKRGFLRMVARDAEPLRWMSMVPWQGVLARPRSG